MSRQKADSRAKAEANTPGTKGDAEAAMVTSQDRLMDPDSRFSVVWRRLSDDTFLTIGKVTWVQDPNLVLEHLRKGDGVTSWDLIFRQARLDQAGDYECQVTSQVKHVRTVTLTVIDEPTFNSQMIVPTGQMIHLVCNVSAVNQTKFDLHWYKNGRRVDSVTYPYFVVTRYQVQSTNMFVTDLIIDNVSLDDSGIYTCRSSSRHIIDTTKVTVIRCKYFFTAPCPLDLVIPSPSLYSALWIL
ncbi:uncharacterized protein LOC143297135 [Babylonia areolata]|uniref:uncharacterized protein LOC143297135 n=1 Tax=Babylonia areolata TaxID=304850 RepID=UPI003FD0FE51